MKSSKKEEIASFKFIDLFSGIGGFHQAMQSFGGECVFASEVDKYCIENYKANYNVDANNDITTTNAEDIPEHDVLCAGFPCQAFSKAGDQNGFNETRGTLFYDILRILEHHKTKYIILENVRNLVSHDEGNTWKVIKKSLKNIGYQLTEVPLILSPHQIGIPQLRERVFILGVYSEEKSNIPLDINLPAFLNKQDNNIYSVVKGTVRDPALNLSKYELHVLEAWDKFYKGVKEVVIGFPIWTEYFRSTISEYENFPKWKQKIIEKNISFYSNNKEFIDSWLEEYDNLSRFKRTDRKFEWQAGADIKSLWEGLIQFRPSGIRVKRPDVFPTLVAMVQTPIIGKFRRRLSINEATKLQSFPTNFKGHPNTFQAYKQLGNSVNVDIVRFAASQILPYEINVPTYPNINESLNE